MSHYEQFTQKHRQLMFDALAYLWKNPETGYREWKAHAYLKKAYEKLGYTLTFAGNIPGFTAEIDTGIPGPTVAVFGELDALINTGHPDADPVTGAVHSCGHCAQSAALLGLAAALKEPGALDGLCGKIRLVVVPAEELIEVEYRESLKKQGTIHYMGGKQEFMYRGLLDGVNLGFMIHTSGGKRAAIDYGSNGCIAKSICFEGVSTHAASPAGGVNALYAANLGLNAINALRETFRDSAHIRVHPIITSGGDAVNAIPDTVKLESYIRGATMKEIVAINRKINRALAASAAAIGANVRLHDTPGYWPQRYDDTMMETMKQAMETVLEGVEVYYGPRDWGTGCSDIGDVSAIMPTVQPGIPGASGKGHGTDYRITDPESACVKSASVQLTMLALLLQEDARLAKQAIAGFKPDFDSMDAYFAYVDKLNLDCKAVTYNAENSVTLNF